MAKTTANRTRQPDLLPDALLRELRERVAERRSELMECLGQEAWSDPGDTPIDVILAAASFRRFAQLYKGAPTRSLLRSRLTKLRDAVRRAGKILGSGDGFLLAALSLGGLTEEEARTLDFGSGSKLQAMLSELEAAADEALALPCLTGPASAQRAWAEGPKTALAIRCARIFEKYRPGKVTRSESKSGGFPAFVRIVYEIATGEMDATLDRAIRDAIAAIRDDRDIKPTSNPLRDAFDPIEELRRHLRKL
jgi:hypothetical protein